MSSLRHCVECPKCFTRYLIAFSPYGNGSYLVHTVVASPEEYILYCSCGRPSVSSRWRWNEVRRYAVSRAAHHRGYGTPEEIVPVGEERRDARSFEMTRLLALNPLAREKNSNEPNR
jgi:hypothetical protein